MTDTPLISVITPSFQQGKFISETIDSVLAQDYPNFEYLMIDGGSTDETIKIIESYQDDPRLSWISEPDQGQVDAIQKGIRRSRGLIIAWLNSDDIYLHPHVLSEVRQIFVGNPTAQLVSGSGVIINSRSEPVKMIAYSPDKLKFEQIKYRNFVLQPSTFVKREVFNHAALNPAYSYVFDWDFWIQCLQMFTITPVNSRWTGYRFWESNKTAQGSSRRTHEQALLAKKYLGDTAWQYFILRTASKIYQRIETLPERAQKTPRKILRGVALVISKLTGDRIAVF